jgi:SSS family solute:Na+ symporter
MTSIIVAAGVLITLYTVLGGIEAVIWTDVVQSIVLMVGAVAVLVMLLAGMPQGPGQAFTIAVEHEKLSLGGFGPSLAESTFWVVLLYGLCENLKNFGIDQSYVQRYHAARDDRAAARSVWLGALLYVPVSLVFFMIGTAAFGYYQTHPAMLDEVRRAKAVELLRADPAAANQPITEPQIAERAGTLSDSDIGDKVLPHFIVHAMPPGLAGLLIAAIMAAAMSSIDTSLNSSATVVHADIWKRYVNPNIGESASMRVLYGATVLFGVIGTGAALAMIGIKSVLDVWWTLSGTFAGGMVGLFLLGLIVKRAGNAAALAGVVLGTAVMVWMTFSPLLTDAYAHLRSPFHGFMTIVIGTMTIFLVGLAASRLRDN